MGRKPMIQARHILEHEPACHCAPDAAEAQESKRSRVGSRSTMVMEKRFGLG